MERGRALALLVVLASLGGHLIFSSHLADLRASQTLLPSPPPLALLEAESFGDRQTAFRLLALQVQNFGDGDGHFTALQDYDYRRLLDWLALLDRLDPRSQTTMALAGTLYGQSGDPAQTGLMADYLYHRAMSDPVRNWHWLALAVHLARFRAHDPVLAMKIAVDLAAVRGPGVPDWVRDMPRFVLSRMSDQDAARQMVEAILASRPDLSKSLERVGR